MGVTASAMTCFSDLGLCNEEPKLRAENSVKQREETIEKAQVKEEENNEKYLVPLKRKIDELCEKRDKAKPFICANGGNVCKNPCYEYQTQLETNCPQCGGVVNKELENGKSIERRFNKMKGDYENITVYDDNVCTKFNWVKDYLKIDMSSYNALKYFTRKKTIDDKNFVEYLCIDGERFDAPPNKNFLTWFIKNNQYFFPQKSKDSNTIFFYENNKAELGQALGYYGHAWKHFVNLYKCAKCGHKYHIIRTSPFRFRDQSLDKYIDNPEEYQKSK